MTQIFAEKFIVINEGWEMKQMELIEERDPQTHAILGAAMEVHTQLGPGFLEPVYQEALAIELAIQCIPFVREAELAIIYKGEALACNYRADFICYSDVIVELKALAVLGGPQEAQVINYLKATGKQRALLINFGEMRLRYKRLVLGYKG
jgi:GxxExxY protein